MRGKSAFWKWLVAVAVVTATVIVVATTLVPNKTDPSPSSLLAAPALGDPAAPITIIEYADFKCVYCGIFSRDIKPELIKEYVDSGKVRFEWRHFPIFGEASRASAHAAACAHEQDAFWAYHHVLYGVGEKSTHRAQRTDDFIDIAIELNLDDDEFRRCMIEGRHEAVIQADFEEGRAHGITGTPSFLIDGRLFVGAHPIETWHRVIRIVDKDDE